MNCNYVLITNSSKEFALMGELSKWVPISNQRITGIDIIESVGIKIYITGSPMELVSMFYMFDGDIHEEKLELPISGKATITMPARL